MPRSLDESEVEAFREEICRVASRRFAESGVGGVTLRALAKELGCSPMTPYRYFKNKEEIFQAVRVDAFRRFNERQLAVGEQHTDPVERLRATARQYVRFAQDDPQAYRIMFQLDPPDGAEHDTQDELERGWAYLVDTMRQAIDQGAFEGDPQDLAHCAWTSLHGLVTLHLAGKLRLGRTVEELVDPVVENLIRGARGGGVHP